MFDTVRILLIDDDKDDKLFFTKAVEKILKKIICEYHTNGEDALAWLATTPALPDYIFLDLNMPRMNGMQVLDEIKRDPRLQPIPVIIYSTSKNEVHKQQAKQLGAAMYITKPGDQMSLRRALLFVFDSVKAPVRQAANAQGQSAVN